MDMNNLMEANNDPIHVERGRYARICVELDLRKRLVPRVLAANDVYIVVYEGLNVICFSCSRYGHRQDTCPSSLSFTQGVNSEFASERAMSQYDVLPVKPSSVVEEKFKEWMLVGYGRRTRLLRKFLDTNWVSEQGKGDMEFGNKGRATISTQFDVLTSLYNDDVEVTTGVENRKATGSGVASNLGASGKVNLMRQEKELGKGNLIRQEKSKSQEVGSSL